MKSQAQRGFLWMKHPDIAKKFEAETQSKTKLPQKVSKRSSQIEAIKRKNKK